MKLRILETEGKKAIRVGLSLFFVKDLQCEERNMRQTSPWQPCRIFSGHTDYTVHTVFPNMILLTNGERIVKTTIGALQNAARAYTRQGNLLRTLTLHLEEDLHQHKKAA